MFWRCLISVIQSRSRELRTSGGKGRNNVESASEKGSCLTIHASDTSSDTRETRGRRSQCTQAGESLLKSRASEVAHISIQESELTIEKTLKVTHPIQRGYPMV